MASDNEASCVSDPNFAVICSFLECFGKSCGINYPDIASLQEMLEDVHEVKQPLVDLHIKLLRKARKTVSPEKWERSLVKFCHTYSNQDGWELERFGYKKARIAVKLRLLKVLLESQFDLNPRFKLEVNKLAAEKLRVEPLGRDKTGLSYWFQLDEECNIRVYREDLDEENWELVASDRQGVVNLINSLSDGEAVPIPVNEDSNSLEISEKPIIDTGQVEDSSSPKEDTQLENNVINGAKPEIEVAKISNSKIPNKDDEGEKIIDNNANGEEDGEDEEEDDEEEEEDEEDDDDEEVSNEESSKQNSDEEEDDEEEDDEEDDDGEDEDDSQDASENQEKSRQIVTSSKIVENHVPPVVLKAKMHVAQKQAPWKAPDEITMVKITKSPAPRPNSVETTPVKAIETPVITTSPLKLVNIQDLQQPLEDRVPREEKFPSKPVLPFQTADSAMSLGKYSIKPIDKLAANLSRIQSEKLEKPGAAKLLEKIAENLARSSGAHGTLSNGDDDKLQQEFAVRSLAEKSSSAGATSRNQRGMDLSTSPRGWENPADHSRPMDYSGIDLSSRKIKKPSDILASAYRAQDFQHREMDLSTRKIGKPDVANLAYDSRTVILRNHTMVTDLSKKQMYPGYEVPSGAAAYHNSARIPAKEDHRLPNYSILPDPSKIASMRMPGGALKRPLEMVDDPQQEMLKRMRAEGLTLRNPMDKRAGPLVGALRREDVVGPAIEEPVMMVQGEGSGSDCDAVNPDFGEAIEEPVIFFYGAGAGRECDTGNPGDETSSDNKESNESKKEGCSDVTTTISPTKILPGDGSDDNEASSASAAVVTKSPLKINANFSQANDTGATDNCQSTTGSSVSPKSKFKPTLGIQVIAKSSGTTPKKSSRWDVGRPENKSEECDSSIISIEGEDISKEDESISANEIQSTETNRLNAEDAQVAERKSESDDITSTSNQTFSQNKIDECSSSVGASDDGEKIQDALECQPDSSVATDTTSAIKESLETAVSEIPHCDSSVATSSSIDPSQTVESIDKGDDAENLVPSKAELEDDTSPRFFFGPNCVSYTSKAEEALANQAATSSVTHESIENAEVAKNNNNFVKIADSFNSESSDASSASNIEARLKNVEISEGKMENPSKSEETEPPECPVQSSTSPRPIDDTDFVAAPEPMDIAIPEPSNDEKISETITTSVDVAKCQEPSECELTAQNQSDVGEDADLQATGAVKLNPEPEPSEPETVSGSIELSTEVAVKDETEKICEAEPSTSVATVETNMEVELEEKRKIQDFATPADGPSMGFSPEEESKDDDTREVSDSCDLLPAAISDETQSCTLPEIAEDSSQNPETNDDKQEESKQLEFTSDVDEKTKQSCESETEDTIAKTIENRNDKETNELCSDDAQDGFAKRSNVSEEAKDTVQSSYSDNAQPAKSDPLDDEKLESADLPEDSTGDSAAPSLTSLIVNPSGDDSSTSDHETIEPTSIPTSVGPFVEEEEIPSERVSPARIIDLNISKSPERITIESEKASSSSRLLDTLDPYTDDLSENQSSADQDSNEAMVIDDRTSDSNGSANDAIPIAEEKSLNFKDKVTPVTISTEKIEPDAECGPCEPIDSVPCESTLDVAISREKNEEIEESSNKDDGKALSDLNVDVVPNSEICEGDKSEVSEAVEAPKKDETELATTSKSKDTTAGVDDVQEKPDTSVQSSLVPNYESSEEDDVNDEVFEAETPETDELEKTPVVNEPVTDKVERLSEIVVSKSLEVSEPKTVVENKDACELKSKLNKEQPEASCENDKDFSEFEDEENDDAEEKLHIDLEEPKKNDAPTDVVEPEELPQTFTGPDKLDKRNLEINESAEVANEISEESRQLSDDVVSTSSEKGLKVSEQVKDAAEETVVDNDSKISNQIPSVIDLQLKKTVSEAEDLAIVETETFSDCPESPKPSEIVVETAVKEFKEHKREDESSTEETIVCKDTDNVVPKIDSASSKIEENVPKDDSKLEAVVDDPVREEIHKNPESLSEVQEETESCEKPESLSDIQNRDEIHEKPESLSAIQDRDEVHEKPESLSTIQDGDEIHEKPDSLSKIQEQDEIPEKSESLSKIQDRDEIPEKSESLSKIQDREDTSEEPESLSKTQDAEDTQEKPESLSEIKDRNEPHEKSEMLSNLHVQEENFEKPDSLSRIQHQEQIPEEPESLCKIQDQKETHENPESLSEVKNQEETQEKSESLSKIQDREEIPEIPELLSKTQTQDDSKTVTVEKVSPITEVASKILEKPDEPEEPDKISSTNLLPLPEISVKSKEQIGNAESSANLEANLLPNAEANLSPEKPKESLIPEREEIEAVALKSESKKEASKRLHGVLDVEDFPPTKSKPPNVDISKEDNNTDIEKKTLAVNDEKTKIDEKSVVASAGTPAQVVTAFASLVSSGPTNPPSALQPNIENLEKTKNQDVAEVTSNFVKSSTPEAAITEEKSSEIQNVDVKYVDLESDDSMGIENDSMFDTNVDDVDPLACTEEDLNKPQDLPIASDPKVGIRVKPVKDLFYEGWKLDSPDPPPVPVRATASRKRRNSAHESNTDEGTAKQEAADDGETGGKRMKLRGKRSPDMKLRKSVEQSRTKSVSSEDEAAKAEASDEIVVLNEIGPTGAAMAKARSERKPRGRPRGKRRRGNRMGGRLSRPIPAESATTLEETPVELDGSVKAAKPSTPPPVDVGQDGKKKRKKRKMVLGLEIGIDIQVPESQSAGGRDEVPVRQSRRIAQLKIKEEADKRRIEEETIDDIKGKKDRDGSDKKKRKKQKPESEEEPEVVIKEVEREVKTKKKRKKKKSSKFNEANPWQSSSGSSTEEEHQEDEDEDEIESEGSLLFKSDHEFSPESDLEKDEESEPLRRARTAQKAQSDVEEAEDEYACQKCGKADHPEWILLCDTCDKGWHCSCLRPALMLIPEGDWFCPPCQHTVLVNKLRDNLKTFDMNSKKHENEVLRKKRLAYVGISLDNVLHKSEGRANDQSSRGSSRSDDSSSSSSESSSSSSSSEESEPVYQLRERRCANTYKFNEYDDMINAAIQAEVDHVRGAGNQGRGKDIATIVNAEKEEAEAEALKTRQLGDDEDDDTKKSDKDSDEDYKLEKEDADEDDEDRNRKTMVRKGLSRKKHRKLNSLDISSEDDPESDEDFKGSSSDEEEDFDDQMESSDDSYAQSRRRGRKGEARPVRRSTRAARKTRYDEDFINDDSDDSDRPKRKKSRSVWDGSDSEDSDNSWRQKKKKSRTAPTPRFRAKSRTKTTKKKKRKRIIEPDNASDNEDDEEAEAEAEAEVERKVETEAEAEAEAEEAEIEAEAELQAEAELGAADEPEVKAQKEESAETEQIIAPFKANPSIESENVAVNENHDAEEHQQDNNIEMPIEDDEERPKKKKKESTPKQKKGPGIRRKIIYGGLHDEGPRQEEETLARRTRGRKINYQDIMGSDSEEELKKVLRKTEESEDEFVVHEGEDPNEEAEKDSDSGDIYSPKKDMPKGKAKSPKAKKLKKSKSPGGRKSLTDNGTPKERKKPGPKPGSKNRPRQSSLTLSPIGKPKDSDSLTRGIDMEGSTMSATGSVIGEVPEGSLTGLTPEDINALDDEDLEQMMMEDEEYGRRQLELAAIEIARKKQEEREAKKLEKARLKALEILAAEQQQQQQRDPNAPEGTDGEVPKKKKRGRRSKAEILAEQMRRDGVSSLLPGSMLPTMVPDSAAAAVSAAAATIVSPNVTPTPTLPTVVQAIETARSPETQMPIMALPDGQLFSPDGSPIKPKRRGRGKGKKTLALEAARAAEAAAKAAGDIGAIGAIGITGTESNPEVKTDDIPNVLPTPGSSTSGSAPPTPPASVVTSQGLPSTLSPNQQPQPQPQQSSVYPALPPSQQSSVITRMLQSQPVSSAPQSFTAAAAAMGHKYFGAPTGAAQMMPGPRATSTYEMPPRGRIPSPYRQPGQPSPMPPHFAAVRSGTPPMRMRLPGAQLYHTPHHPMDPSPSGGGPISINSRDRSSPLGPGAGPGPAMIPPAAGSPLAKGGPTPPPPPYVRGGPALARFPDNPQMAPRHQLPPFTTPASANHNMQQPSPPPNRPPGNFSPYHPPPPPNYHYGAYPPPPPMTTADDAAAYQGSPYSAEHFSTPAESQPQIQQPQPPPQPQPGPQQPHANETPGPGNKQYDEEGTGEFGGLVSYFSSQREDDLDS